VTRDLRWLFALALIDGRGGVRALHIPFILLTARMDRSNKLRNALSAGAETRLLKLDYIHLIAALWPRQVF
jgi:hypothetical protein